MLQQTFPLLHAYRLLAVSLSVLGAVASAEATDYYVDASGGADTNSGTSPVTAGQS